MTGASGLAQDVIAAGNRLPSRVRDFRAGRSLETKCCAAVTSHRLIKIKVSNCGHATCSSLVVTSAVTLLLEMSSQISRDQSPSAKALVPGALNPTESKIWQAEAGDQVPACVPDAKLARKPFKACANSSTGGRLPNVIRVHSHERSRQSYKKCNMQCKMHM